MRRLTEFDPGKLYLVTGSREYVNWQMHRWIVEAALSAPVIVFVGGNRYAVYDVNYAVAAVSEDYEHILDHHILLSRADTCYQMTGLLRDADTDGRLVLVMDMLATFYDDGVPEREVDRLLFECLLGLRRMRERAPVIISAAERASRPRLLNALARQAAEIIRPSGQQLKVTTGFSPLDFTNGEIK